MSRDSDSAITSREEEAVGEWLASNKSFHIMRDHPAHCFFGFIMGCKFFHSYLIELAVILSTMCYQQAAGE